MSLPIDPKLLKAKIDRIHNRLDLFMEEYTDIYPSTHSPTKRGDSDYTKGGDHPEVYNGWASTKRVRNLLEQSASKIDKIYGMAESSIGLVVKAESVIDSTAEPEVEVAPGKVVPHPADKGDVREALRAQKRRQYRGTTNPLPGCNDETGVYTSDSRARVKNNLPRNVAI